MVQQDSANEVLFEEVQQFRQPWLWALLLIMFLVLTGTFAGAIFIDPQTAVITAGAVWIGLILFFLLIRMTVRVDHHHLHVRFLPLLKKDIPLEDIASWEACTYRPILEYGGWGLRYGWKGWAYNVSGNRGIQLVLTNGKRILIGSQRPEELAAAIKEGKR